MISLTFTTCPERASEMQNALASVADKLNNVSDITVIYNRYDAKCNWIDSALSHEHSNILKICDDKSISWCWNQAIMLSRSRYVMLGSDDILFKDPNWAEKTIAKHKEGIPLVHLTEAFCCSSVDKALIGNIGFFEERLPYSWEDVDFRYRMERQNFEQFRFKPELVQHLRAGSVRNQEKWDESSRVFFKKWGIDNYLNRAPMMPVERYRFLTSGQFDKINSRFLSEPTDIVNYYPHVREKYQNEYGRL